MRRSPLLAFALLVAGCGGTNVNGGGPVDDAGSPPDQPADLSVAGGPYDLAWHPYDLASPPNPPLTGSVSAKGGTVSRLYFGFTGDTRPPSCDDTAGYPTAIVSSIYKRMAAQGVQFALDLGDHMFVCSGTQQTADTQMGYYTTAAAQLAPRPAFMTLGNHECGSHTVCSVSGFQNVNFKAFLKALAPISATPYYSFDVQTNFGLARFVVIADNAWGADEQAWLESTLADADQNAKFVFVARHHPLDNTDLPDYPTITKIIRAHKRTIVLTGHSHEFKLDTTNDPTGRTLVMGIGGAPLTDPNGYWGYGTVEQMASGTFAVRLYDQATGNVMSNFLIAP